MKIFRLNLFGLINKILMVLSILTCLILFPLLFPQTGLDWVYAQANRQSASIDNGTPEGWKIIDGDILVPIVSPQGLSVTNLWPDGIVPLEFAADLADWEKTRVWAACNEWEGVCSVDFVKRSGQSDYVYVQKSNVNSAPVGWHPGKNVVNIVSWRKNLFAIVHEIGHVLGLWHEHARSDRDIYITINWENIPSGTGSSDFKKRNEALLYPPNVYDFDSIMHYGECDLSCCNTAPSCKPDICSPSNEECHTITVNSPWHTTWQQAIGQRDHLSKYDKITMSFLYPESNWVFVDRSYTGSTQVGTFLQPYKQLNGGTTAVPSGGTVNIQPGNYNETGIYAKAMTLRAPVGELQLGSGIDPAL